MKRVPSFPHSLNKMGGQSMRKSISCQSLADMGNQSAITQVYEFISREYAVQAKLNVPGVIIGACIIENNFKLPSDLITSTQAEDTDIQSLASCIETPVDHAETEICSTSRNRNYYMDRFTTEDSLERYMRLLRGRRKRRQTN